MSASSAPPVLDVRNLSISIDNDGDLVPITEQTSFSIGRGEVLALVGESGSGKSVTALSLMQLLGANLQRRLGRDPARGAQRLPRRYRKARDARRADPGDPRRAHGDDLPGADELLLAHPHDRRADRRSRRGARGREPRRSAPPGRGPARQGRHPRSQGRARPLPLRVLGRHAAARDDRPGPDLRPKPPHRR